MGSCQILYHEIILVPQFLLAASELSWDNKAMNTLKIEKQATVIKSLVEGCSVRSVERLTGIHRDTILRLMVRVSETAASFMDRTLRGLSCKRIEIDEAWCFVAKKQRHVRMTDDPDAVGDFWCFVGLDPDSKLIPSHLIGKRDARNAIRFVGDLSSRMRGRIQLSSDMLRQYVDAVDLAFAGQVDYGRVVKSYEAVPVGPSRYSPPKVVSVTKDVVVGNPDPAHISTSLVERSNLSLRMGLRRFTRLTNGFSKKVENLRAAVAVYLWTYNFAKVHGTLRMSPAMAAGVTPRMWSIEELVDMAR